MSMRDIHLKLEDGHAEITDQFGGKLEIYMQPLHDGIIIRMPGAHEDLRLSREQIRGVFPHLRALFEIQGEWIKIHPDRVEEFPSPK